MALIVESSGNCGNAALRSSRRARSLGARARSFSPDSAVFGNLRLVVKHTFLDFEIEGSEAEETRWMLGLPQAVKDWDVASISTSASSRACVEASDSNSDGGQPSSDTASDGDADILDLASDGEFFNEAPEQAELVAPGTFWPGACWTPESEAQWLQACYGQGFCPPGYGGYDCYGGYYGCYGGYYGMYPADYPAGTGVEHAEGARPSSNDSNSGSASRTMRSNGRITSSTFRDVKQDPELWNKGTCTGRLADMDDDLEESNPTSTSD